MGMEELHNENGLNSVNEEKRYKLERPITGIIQKDRIWEQWYSPSIFTQQFPKMSQKDYLFKCIGDDKNRVIIDNRGMKKLTVADFQAMILEFERAFSAMNFNKGDIVCTISLTTPEMLAIKYASTSLGLITCNLNVFDAGIEDNGKNRLIHQLEVVNPKIIFTLDILEDKVYKIINDSKFSEIIKVSMPLERSTPKWNPERVVMAFKKFQCRLKGKVINNQISLCTFLKRGLTVSTDSIKEIYEENLPCNISFTSGTTGINKAVLLSHDANNALAFQQKLGNFGFARDCKNLALVPPFLAFWDADIIHSVLCLGGVEIIELFLDYKKIPQYFKKHKAQMGIWSQYLWDSLLTLSNKKLKKICQNIKHVIIGGERCEISAAQNFYKKTGIIQMTGFGASEVNTAFSITHPNCNKIGAAGLPLPFNNVKIVDEEMKDVTYNIPGRLFITGPCLMNGYYKREDLTSKVIFTDEEGVSWYNTGDYAVVDNDGCLTVLDRYIPPVEILTNGKTEKVNMLDVVEIIKKEKGVKICKMTYHDGKLVLHASFNAFVGFSMQNAIDNLLDFIKHNLPEKYFPDIIIAYKELPRTAVGKVEYKKLEEIGEKYAKEMALGKKLFIVEY